MRDMTLLTSNMVPHFHVPQFHVSHFQRPRHGPVSVRPSVCLSVRPLQVGVVLRFVQQDFVVQVVSALLRGSWQDFN